MKFDLAGWKVEMHRFDSMGRFNIIIYDEYSKKELTFSKKHFVDICTRDKTTDSEYYKNIMNTIKELEELHHHDTVDIYGFHRIIEYLQDNDPYTGSFVTTVYASGYADDPEFVIYGNASTFNYKLEAWGIDKEVFNEIIKRDIKDIRVFDDKVDLFFLVTTRKFKTNMEEMDGKVYLPVKHFEIHRIWPEHPDNKKSIKYKKSLEGMKIEDL